MKYLALLIGVFVAGVVYIAQYQCSVLSSSDSIVASDADTDLQRRALRIVKELRLGRSGNFMSSANGDEVCDLSCGQHGACTKRLPGAEKHPGPVCVCRDGYWGRNCTRSAEEWERIANLKAHRKSATLQSQDSLWWYLNSTAYRMRSVMAASRFHDRQHILEIGGLYTPINLFIRPDAAVRTVTVIDPVVQPFSKIDVLGRQILDLPTTLQEYDMRGDEDGILFLGIPKEYPLSQADLIPCAGSIKTVVLGCARYKPIMRTLQKIVDRCKGNGFFVDLDVTLDFADMVGHEHPEISSDPDNHKRRFVVLERK